MNALSIEPIALSIAVSTGCNLSVKPSGIAAHNSKTPAPMTEAHASRSLIQITMFICMLSAFQIYQQPFRDVTHFYKKVYGTPLRKVTGILQPVPF